MVLHVHTVLRISEPKERHMHSARTRGLRTATQQDESPSSVSNLYRRGLQNTCQTAIELQAYPQQRLDRAATEPIAREDYFGLGPGTGPSSLAGGLHRDSDLNPIPPTRDAQGQLYGGPNRDGGSNSTLVSILLAPAHLIIAVAIWISAVSISVFDAIKTSKGWVPISLQLRKIFFGSWLHVLLLLIPVGLVLHYTRRNPVVIFFVNFAAMVPSIMIMSLAVDSILAYVGELLGVLVATTFSNSALLITSALLLRSRQLVVLRISLMGAILSNLMLMPGLAFLCGGFNRFEQSYNMTAARTAGEMLLLAVGSLMIPSAADIFWLHPEGTVQLSRGTAFLLMICYGCLLLFQLRTHHSALSEPSTKAETKGRRPVEQGDVSKAFVRIGARNAGSIATPHHLMMREPGSNRYSKEPELPLLTAFLTLAVFTVLLSFNTLLATDSIQGLLLQLNLSETFLGIVVLPIISNDPATIIVAMKDYQDLMLGLTLGRCVQIALLVFPFIVLLAWMMGIDEMSLSFNSYQTVIILAGVWALNYVLQTGKSHWFSGVLLVANYMIISVSAYYFA